MKSVRGFTLIELLVVIAIITILSTIGLAVYSSIQKSARISKRIGDLKAISTALESYYSQKGKYPTTSGAGRSECNTWGGLVSDQVIKDTVSGDLLVPTYLVAFPQDPQMDKANNKSCYLYSSNGLDYKLFDYQISEFNAADYLSQKNLVDPVRDGGSNASIVDGTNPWSWAVWTNKAVDW